MADPLYLSFWLKNYSALGLPIYFRKAIEVFPVSKLAPGGTLLLYTGVAMLDNQDPFLAEVRRRLQGGAFSWTYREVDPDVFGEELLGGAYIKCDRIAAVVLEVTRPAC